MAVVAACSARAGAQTAWLLAPPAEARRTGVFANRHLDESSGVAASRRYPGVLWSHEDSGGDPLLFATDTSGADRGTFNVRGAANVDWEDVALGPCDSSTCVYLADTGDNRERRKSASIWRVPEPDAAAARPGHAADTAPAERVEFRYPGGARDVEAMWVDPSGDVHLVAKGRHGPAVHYRLPAALWSARDGKRPAVADSLGVLPIAVQRGVRRLVTGAALSPDGRRVVVRTYGEAYFFARRADGSLALPPRPLACDLAGLEPQGEGVAWLDDTRLVLTSERGMVRTGTVTVVRCALPPLTS